MALTEPLPNHLNREKLAVGLSWSRVMPVPQPPPAQSPRFSTMLLDLLPEPGGQSASPRLGLVNCLVGKASLDSA